VEAAKALSAHMNVAVAGIFGGVNMRTQMERELGDKCDLLVATPGRLLDAILGGAVKTKMVKKLVIDEVDEMLSLGFRRQIERVLDLLPERRQNLLFSATMQDEVVALMDTFFTSPAMVEAAPVGTPLENIEQRAYLVPNFNTKIALLDNLLRNNPDMSKVMVFTATKALADLVYGELSERFPETIGVIHSNKEQNYRFNTVRLFADGTYRAIVSTDIIARGLDIGGVSHVVNFDLPEVAEHYIHRIGRTGRADKTGIAVSFITPKDTAEQESIEALMKYTIPMLPMPEGVEISEELIELEMPVVKKRELSGHLTSREDKGTAFHERAEHNKKKNVKVRYADKMKEKYGKPKTRGPKSQKRKK
jgi:ATP-dependent RNA helicase RhlE